MRSCKCVLVAGDERSRKPHGYERLPREEVAQVDKLAMRFILNVNNAPTRLAAADGLTIHDHGAL